MTCDHCIANVDVYEDGGTTYARLVTVRLCPLHAAAEEMRDALMAFVEDAKAGNGGDVSIDVSEAEALLARLEAKP